MRGNELDVPLLLSDLIQRAATVYPAREVVTSVGNAIEVANYKSINSRAQRFGAALADRCASDVVGTFAWNTADHLTAWFGITGIGKVCHTLNVRLSLGELACAVEDSRPEVVVVSSDLLETWQRVAAPSVKRVIVIDGHVDGYDSIDDYSQASSAEAWPSFDERTAAFLCHTSGTTGRPKGVLLSHRAMWLHTAVHGHVDVHGISESDVTLVVVPMFHANAWGIPLAATMSGARQVMAGVAPKAQRLLELIVTEGVTYAAGVPAVWQPIVEIATASDFAKVRRVCMGGYPAPLPLLRAFDRLGVDVQQGYGMTETGPLAVRTHAKVEHQDRADELRRIQGLPVPGMLVRLESEDGEDVAHDGRSVGEVMFRSPWTVRRYLGADSDEARDGWFATGDLATIDEDHYIHLVDRAKDLVKTGGEWISSVDVETKILGFSGIAEAAVVGRPDKSYGERPVAFVVLQPDCQLPEAELRAHLATDLTKWQIPDEFLIVAELPRTSVGKVDKKKLRRAFG